MEFLRAAGKGEVEFGVVVLVHRLEMHLQQAQLRSMAGFADKALIWSLRSKYAVHRPAGWRSQPGSRVSWRYTLRACASRPTHATA